MRKAYRNSGLALAVFAGLSVLVPGKAARGQTSTTAAAAPPASVAAASPAAVSPSSSAAPRGPLVVLDRVEAVVDGEVILKSDVEEEMRMAALQPVREDPTANTEAAALSRLIDRDLILEQMKSAPAPAPASEQEIEQRISQLRAQIPDCAEYHCKTEAGWRALLAARGLTEAEVSARWRQRMEILSFIQSRFGAGVRVSRPEIEQYYNQEFTPEFAKRGLPPPPLETVSSRIQEVLLQRKVNSLLQDWLESLKEDGSVTILSSAVPPPGAGPAGSVSADGGTPGVQR